MPLPPVLCSSRVRSPQRIRDIVDPAMAQALLQRGKLEAMGLDEAMDWCAARAREPNAIEAVARFAATHESELEELDVNPLMVLENGKGAIAADALVRMRKN